MDKKENRQSSVQQATGFEAAFRLGKEHAAQGFSLEYDPYRNLADAALESEAWEAGFLHHQFVRTVRSCAGLVR